MDRISDAQLARIMRNASHRRRAQWLPAINVALQSYGLDALPRAAAFLAQLAYGSGELEFTEEPWGPTPTQLAYEADPDLAHRLGNTERGDGARYRGRGAIRITGRASYTRVGQWLDLDLEGQPELALRPDVGCRIAAEYWLRNGFNALADAGDVEGISARMGGAADGPGLAEQRRLHDLALQVLAPGWTEEAGAGAQAEPAQEGKGARKAPRAPARRRVTHRPVARLSRGTEAVLAYEMAAAPPGRTPAGAGAGIGAGAGPAGARGRASSAPRRRAAAPAAPSESTAAGAEGTRVFDVRPDTLDFRDRMYDATLVEVPTHVPLGEFLAQEVPVLDQGSEGACTGFGLATVANYLLRRRQVLPDAKPVSPRMLYELARRYDEWPGEDYEGASARGAMKGWHKHGVCSEALYPWRVGRGAARGMTDERTADALRRPLGSYFRVNHKDLVAMHAAIAEVGVLYATCAVHQGWRQVGGDGVIEQSDAMLGGHAFAIVAYDEQGFWLQNSWGPTWGRGGFARISYDDWLGNGTDVWVARLGAPVVLRRRESVATVHAGTAAQSNAYAYADLRPHIVSVGNDGALKAGGDYGSTPEELARVFEEDIPRAVAGWAVPRVLLYAHGGLVGEQAAVQRLAEYRPMMLGGQCYPLAFVWRTDFWSTLTGILKDAVGQRRSEGILDAAKDFMLDRLDDALEPLARALGGRLMWTQMKQNALAASDGGGAAVRVADHLQALARRLPGLEVHLVGHSAGSVLLAPLVDLLAGRGLAIKTCTLWAPACTVALFRDHYLPAIRRQQIRKFALFLLSDQAEQDDNCARIYNKSLLYLVSHAFEDEARIPWSPTRLGVPLLGMLRWHDEALQGELVSAGVDVVVAPNNEPAGSPNASGASTHGAFDDDSRTVAATFSRVLAAAPAPAGSAKAGAPRGRTRRRGATAQAEPPPAAAAAEPVFPNSDASRRDRRQIIDLRTRKS